MKMALKGPYRSFVTSGLPIADIDDSVDRAKPHVKALIADQLKEMQSTKVTMTLRVRWKKPVK